MRLTARFLGLCVIIFYARPARAVTWSREIAPIIYKHCTYCHRDGQPAPFRLLSYADAKSHASLIAKVTTAHYMPPWLPLWGYGRFAGERVLSAHEIFLISAWARSGAPQGDPSLAPPPPEYRSEWQLGAPDQIVSLPHPLLARASGPDEYRCFVVPLSLGQDRYVDAFQFQPSGAQALHHALFFVDGRQKEDLPPDYECFGAPGFLPTAAIGGWTPGSLAVRMPHGTAIHIARGARLVMQLHFHPTGKAESVNPRLALYFAAQPPTRYVMDVPLGSNRIDIPPGDASYKVTDHFNLPVAVEVTGVIPHAHYICKEMKAWAILPGGGRRWLLWIKNWDFNRQEQYHYEKPFTLPPDTELRMEFTYDNSAGNPRNPNHPPERVQWGPSSTDEMAGLHLQVIPANDDDMHELGKALWGKFMRSAGGEFYRKP